jgi:hypothetical protein
MAFSSLRTLLGAGAVSGSIAVFGGGTTGSNSNVLDQVNISSLADATSWGTLVRTCAYLGACSSGANDKGLFMGGDTSGVYGKPVDAITISNPSGGSSDWGDLHNVHAYTMAGASNGTGDVGVMAGGWT